MASGSFPSGEGSPLFPKTAERVAAASRREKAALPRRPQRPGLAPGAARGVPGVPEARQRPCAAGLGQLRSSPRGPRGRGL